MTNSLHSSILAWEIPWSGEPGGLQTMGLQSDTTEHNAHGGLSQEVHGSCIAEAWLGEF